MTTLHRQIFFNCFQYHISRIRWLVRVAGQNKSNPNLRADLIQQARAEAQKAKEIRLELIRK